MDHSIKLHTWRRIYNHQMNSYGRVIDAIQKLKLRVHKSWDRLSLVMSLPILEFIIELTKLPPSPSTYNFGHPVKKQTSFGCRSLHEMNDSWQSIYSGCWGWHNNVPHIDNIIEFCQITVICYRLKDLTRFPFHRPHILFFDFFSRKKLKIIIFASFTFTLLWMYLSSRW